MPATVINWRIKQENKRKERQHESLSRQEIMVSKWIWTTLSLIGIKEERKLIRIGFVAKMKGFVVIIEKKTKRKARIIIIIINYYTYYFFLWNDKHTRTFCMRTETQWWLEKNKQTNKLQRWTDEKKKKLKQHSTRRLKIINYCKQLC